MKVAVAKETHAGETRVAVSAETVKKLIALGADIRVEKGAGLSSAITDEAYEKAGAKIVDAAPLADADLVLCVRAPSNDAISGMKAGALLVGMLDPYQSKDMLDACAAAKVKSFAMEFVPRITRAQTMDVLSSQANLAGYRAVIEAAHAYGCGFPLMMTAAGTVPPAKIFIMGAGVAGLQAVATAKRLGAQVNATDVRPAVKEQVESLGGTFVMVEDEETEAAETSGGYAKEMSDEYKRKQADLIAQTITKQDIIITTALIPGRKAPILVTEEMVKTMKPGSVILDMAVAQGGNCELAKPDQTVEKYGVKIVGISNLPARIAANASSLYARNLLAFLTPMIDKEQKTINVDTEDEIIAATLLTADGAIIHPNLQPQEAA